MVDGEPATAAAQPPLVEQTWAHVVGAAVSMGAWAVFMNHVHGPAAAFRAGAAQAAFSTVVTFTLKTGLEALTRRLRGVAAFVVPPTISCTVIGSLLVTVHYLAGTRELWSTIAIPFSASSAYAWLYVYRLASGRSAVSRQ